MLLIIVGGLRIVTPNTADQFVLEGSRQFDEAYGLSFAQQLKNKDIPEVRFMSFSYYLYIICVFTRVFTHVFI